MAAVPAAGVFGVTSLNRALWPHQVRALSAVQEDCARGDSATYLVVPPGGGKTLIGLEAARQLGQPTIVLCPNTAIQAQWMLEWRTGFSPAVVPATGSRELPTALTVLTYQALCTLGSAGNGDGPGDVGPWAGPGRPREPGRWGYGEGPDREEVLSLLHPNGRALVDQLRTGGPWTVVLDECHHLLELWGRLLEAVIGQLDAPRVVGLTATPPHMMTAEQAGLHRRLFGGVDLEISAPALVREGRLAPYQELAFLTRPSPAEADYIHGEAIRFAELRAGLLDPGFASTPFLAWLQARVVERRGPAGAQVSWQRFERDEPALAEAAIRMHTAGLLELPEGARVREQHRHPPTAADWVTVIGDYSQRCLRASDDPRDKRALEAIRRALPAVGYRLTRAGVRAGESPVGRVLARSESKAHAVIEILGAESADLGARLRALVLCDYAEASGTLPADLTGVQQAGAGSAVLVLETLLAAPQTAALDPVLMTGQHLACGVSTAQRLISWLHAAEPDLALAASDWNGHRGMLEITGPPAWNVRRYVPLVTRFYSEGGSRCLIGTRALLGEGWDAPAVNVVVDLTAATTPTSVVQARGRALRLDAGWPGKVADNWGVICVSSDHPKGSADFDRFARKHDRYFALARTGDIISGVAHVDPVLSPYTPPPEDQFAALNAVMLQRAADRAAARERWAIGTPYQDEPEATVTVTAQRTLGLPRQAVQPLARRRPWAGWSAVAALAATLAVAITLASAPAAVLAAAILLAALAALVRTARRVTAAPGCGSLEDIAAATADALHTAHLISRGSDDVAVEPQADGSYRARLRHVPARESALFADALDETLSPLSQPRYVIQRLIITPPPGPVAAARLLVRRLVTGHIPATVVYHAVPAVLGINRRLAAVFEQAWNAHVCPGQALYTGSPEGAGVLTAQRGDDPFALTTQIRTLWR